MFPCLLSKASPLSSVIWDPSILQVPIISVNIPWLLLSTSDYTHSHFLNTHRGLDSRTAGPVLGLECSGEVDNLDQWLTSSLTEQNRTFASCSSNELKYLHVSPSNRLLTWTLGCLGAGKLFDGCGHSCDLWTIIQANGVGFLMTIYPVCKWVIACVI